ncbi:hypothetical protein EDC96DRAFT_329173 [Choanephora cucurbitarum]|nr:hypothetical protein EDC96DRAFT_329173 [Choanephora cucurbitarum]
MDELYSPLSFVRGTDQERKAFLRDEQNRTYRSFGNMYQPHIKRSTFYSAQVAAPVRSKRTQHQSNQSTSSRLFPRIRLTHSAKPPMPSLAYHHSSSNSTSGQSMTSPSISSRSSSINRKGGSHSRSSSNSSTSLNSSMSGHSNSHNISTKQIDHRIHPTNHRQDKQAPKKEVCVHQEELHAFLPLDTICSEKLIETSTNLDQLFWRSQCRAFVLSRYLNEEEAVNLAKKVYKDPSITSSSHQIASLQENLKKFRARLKTIILSYQSALRITLEKLTENNQAALEGKVRKLVRKRRRG